MPDKEKIRQVTWMAAFLGICLGSTGCLGHWHAHTRAGVPSEAAKAALPAYVIEPPDVLQIDALRLVPRPPYNLMPLDEVGIRFPAVPENLNKDDLEDLVKTGRVISGAFTIEPEGTVNLGPIYGRVKVADLTVDQARDEVEKRLAETIAKRYLEKGKVFVELTQFRGMQQVRGDHLVRPDGTVSLGVYGNVMVFGRTLDEAKAAIEEHLSRFMVKPEVSVDVSGYNSKVYYVIFDGAGYGEQVYRFPVTGSETVLDAIGQVNGLPPVASKKRIWIARPPQEGHEDDILPVDWQAITRHGRTACNYQILPGDRIYVQAESVITTNTYIDRWLQPLERLMGGTLLGVATYRTLRFIGSVGGQGGIGGGGFGF
jgi:polysaccharide export outer membrane protein